MTQRERELIEAFLNGELPPEQLTALEAWLAEDREHMRTFVRTMHTHRQLRELTLARAPQLEFGLEPTVTGSGITRLKLDNDENSVFERAAESRNRRRRHPRLRSVSWLPLSVTAAAAAILLVAALFLLNRPSKDPLARKNENPRQRAAAPSVATLVAAKGVFSIQRSGQALQAMHGTELWSDDVVSVGAAGEVQLRFANEDTVLKFSGTSHATLAAGGKRVVIERSSEQGRIDAQVAPQNPQAPLQFVTAHAHLTVLGTKLSILTDRSHARLEVEQGRVRMQRGAESVEVGAGEFAVALEGVALAACSNLKHDPGAFGIVSFTLIDADKDTAIAAFDPLPQGGVINLAKLPTRRLNIRINTTPATVGCVAVSLDGKRQLEAKVPYAATRDIEGQYQAWTPTPGAHTISATAYSGTVKVGDKEPKGNPGTPLTVRFYVVKE